MNLAEFNNTLKEVADELETEENRDYDDYTVFETSEFGQESIGEVQLFENAEFKDMPKELEINGFTYKLEE